MKYKDLKQKQRWAEVCEMCFGDGLTPSEIARRLNTYPSVISNVLEKVMFFKRFDAGTVDECEFITRKSKV